MSDGLTFPVEFLWGAATAAHQVEGDNTNSDWWDWENRADSPVPEPSGRACEHYTRYADDVRLLADAGLNSYRFSVEWARVEPSEGEFDEAQLDHYVRMTDVVRAAGLTPVVTLHHFTLPRWLAARGGWTDRGTPRLFGRYCERVVRALGGRADWFCTINEPGNIAVGGHLGVFGWPPGTTSYGDFRRAADGLTAGHRVALEAVKSVRPDARVGVTHGMQEWAANAAGRSPMRAVRRMFEDIYLEASTEDDFVGVQTYTRVPVDLPAALLPATALVGGVPALRHRVLPKVMRQQFQAMAHAEPADGVRRTQMGYEFRPEAIAATLRRAAKMLPGKDLLVTEHGIATSDDVERVEFIERGLTAVHEVMAEGLPVRGYLYWSLLDNFEWAHGYRPTFGLVGVDRQTMARTPRPSLAFLGDVAKSGRLQRAR
ncbi:MAG TPA: family 1 glycosylhydrolase [Mycobacteriales bacterium]|nr:family 1 glycosylhydrolase [Mycobacteriales bacterium]